MSKAATYAGYLALAGEGLVHDVAGWWRSHRHTQTPVTVIIVKELLGRGVSLRSIAATLGHEPEHDAELGRYASDTEETQAMADGWSALIALSSFVKTLAHHPVYAADVDAALNSPELPGAAGRPITALIATGDDAVLEQVRQKLLEDNRAVLMAH